MKNHLSAMFLSCIIPQRWLVSCISFPAIVVAEFSTYKPLLIMFGLVNGFQEVLKVC